MSKGIQRNSRTASFARHFAPSSGSDLPSYRRPPKASGCAIYKRVEVDGIEVFAPSNQKAEANFHGMSDHEKIKLLCAPPAPPIPELPCESRRIFFGRAVAKSLPRTVKEGQVFEANGHVNPVHPELTGSLAALQEKLYKQSRRKQALYTDPITALCERYKVTVDELRALMRQAGMIQ